MTRITGALLKDLFKFMIASCLILLRKETFQVNKAERNKTRILCSTKVSQNYVLYEIMCQKHGRCRKATHNIIWRKNDEIGLSDNKGYDTDMHS
jgi:hypothetical protein